MAMPTGRHMVKLMGMLMVTRTTRTNMHRVIMTTKGMAMATTIKGITTPTSENGVMG